MIATISLDDVLRARAALQPLLAPSPLVEVTLTGRRCYLKVESALVTGSFKIRGAMNAVQSHLHSSHRSGFVTASSGNQGIALSHAASTAGSLATIVLPHGCSPAKIDLIRRHGGRIRFYGEDVLESEHFARTLPDTDDLTFISCCDTPTMLAGYGSIALEILEQCPDVTAIVAPVGGGGLLGSLAFTCAQVAPHVKVIGVQSEHTPAMFNLLYGTSLSQSKSMCDALAGGIDTLALGARLCREHPCQVTLVAESAVRLAMGWALDEHDLLIEPSAACPVAALMTASRSLPSGPVALVLSGGNVKQPPPPR